MILGYFSEVLNLPNRARHKTFNCRILKEYQHTHPSPRFLDTSSSLTLGYIKIGRKQNRSHFSLRRSKDFTKGLIPLCTTGYMTDL